MKLTIDKEADALYLDLDETPAVESEEISPGVILDYNSEGKVTGIEPESASADGDRSPPRSTDTEVCRGGRDRSPWRSTDTEGEAEPERSVDSPKATRSPRRPNALFVQTRSVLAVGKSRGRAGREHGEVMRAARQRMGCA